MRYVTLRILSEGDSMHTIGRDTIPPSVGRGPIHRVELLADGSVVVLRSVTGDLPAYREVLADHDAVYSFAVTGHDEGHVFVHHEPTDLARDLLEWRRRLPVLVRTPIEFEGDDPVVTLVGKVDAFTDATASLPDGATFEVYETGRFSPQDSAPFHGLTDRQREILAAAIRLGYYENPRDATQADIASAMSLSPGTVGDHLRKIEAHVFSAYTGPRGQSGDVA